MKIKIEEGFLDYFSELEDPRVERTRLYPIGEILFLTLCGMLCGCESWEDMEDFGETKIDFLRGYFEYKNGTPSDDTLRRFFRALDTQCFQACFVKWVKSLEIETKAGVIALDGKSSRRTFDGDQKPLHVVSAFASESRLVLGQEKVPDKSNEITALKSMVEWLDMKGCMVTIDAMGCQTEIADKIVEKEGDYLFGLKGNQGTLHDDVKLFFESKHLNPESKVDFETTTKIEKGHGRIETRTCSVCTQVDWLTKRHPRWKSISAIVQIQSKRDLGNRVTQDTRYFITSRATGAKAILSASRSHWAIENSLHWVLDMSFGDDQSRIRKDNAPMNMAILKHITLNMIRQAKSKSSRTSIRRMRKIAGWDDAILTEIISQNLELI